MWFQQDRATCRTARDTINLLKATFGERIISRNGPVNCLPRSCDLTPVDYFLWGYVKSLVYADKPETIEHNIFGEMRPRLLRKLKIQIAPSTRQLRRPHGRNDIQTLMA